jgi:hypothetical protein
VKSERGKLINYFTRVTLSLPDASTNSPIAPYAATINTPFLPFSFGLKVPKVSVSYQSPEMFSWSSHFTRAQ